MYYKLLAFFSQIQYQCLFYTFLNVFFAQLFNKQEDIFERVVSVMKITESLKNIRKSKGFSQEQVADYIGIDTTNYGRIERGQSSITFDRLIQLADLYEMTVVELVIEITNTKTNSVKDIVEQASLIETVDYLKKEVAFLRESLIAKDFQISQLIEVNKEFKTIYQKK
jgi:transcriptional regulator with XRE-family HTH domain